VDGPQCDKEVKSTMDTGNKQKKRYAPTGLSDEAFDIIVSLHHKLNELWHIDEAMADAGGGQGPWQAIREHDRQDIDLLVQALKQSLNKSGA